MKKITLNVKVEIGPIYASKIQGDSRGYYNFDWWIYENGKLADYGNCDGSFTNGKTANAQRKMLQRGEAVRIVLGNYYQ